MSFWYIETCSNWFSTNYGKLRKVIWPSDPPLANQNKSRKTTMDKYYPQKLFCNTWISFWYVETWSNWFSTCYGKLRKVIWPSNSPLANYDNSRKTIIDKYYPQTTILWHLNLFLVRRDMLKLIFDPLRKVTKKLFCLPIHHWPITIKVARLLWINTIPKWLFCDTWMSFWYVETCSNWFSTNYGKLRKSYFAFRFTIGWLWQNS